MSSFAIIGTRNPDQFQRELAERLAARLSAAGHCIRTGGADGIDAAAMKGTGEGFLDVVLPWPGYNSLIIPQHARVLVYDPDIHDDWLEAVHLYHPNPGALSRGAYALHARNYGILMPAGGPVKRVISMPDASGGGGTGQGIRIAKGLGIPCTQINRGQMKDRASLERVFAHIVKLCIG